MNIYYVTVTLMFILVILGGIDQEDVGTLRGIFSGEDLCSTVPLTEDSSSFGEIFGVVELIELIFFFKVLGDLRFRPPRELRVDSQSFKPEFSLGSSLGNPHPPSNQNDLTAESGLSSQDFYVSWTEL